jgi:hypothetical protein
MTQYNDTGIYNDSLMYDGNILPSDVRLGVPYGGPNGDDHVGTLDVPTMFYNASTGRLCKVAAPKVLIDL